MKEHVTCNCEGCKRQRVLYFQLKESFNGGVRANGERKKEDDKVSEEVS